MVVPDNYEAAVAERIRIYREGADGEPLAALINVGGGTATTGPNAIDHFFDSGLQRSAPSRAFRVPSVMGYFLREEIPVINFSGIRSLSTRYGLPYPPQQIQAQTYPHVGTTLFNMAVNPVNGKVYISNTDANNDVRFEGHNPGMGVTSVRGEIVDSRITVLDPATGAMQYNDLNPHIIDGEGEGDLSLAFPQDMAVSADGAKLMVVAQGSGKLAIYDTADLEGGSITANANNQISLSAGGPSGVVYNDKTGQAYVMTRFDNGISVVDVAGRKEVAHTTLYNPEPEHIIAGRRFLYDARYTSATCAPSSRPGRRSTRGT